MAQNEHDNRQVQVRVEWRAFFSSVSLGETPAFQLGLDERQDQ